MPNFDRGTSGLPRGWIEDYNKIVKKLSKGKGYGTLSRSDKQKVWAALGKKYVESVNEAKTVSIDGEELMNFLMKRFKYSKKKAIDVMKKHKMDTSFLKKESVNESSYTQRSILDFIKANKAAVESDPANIPRIKLFGPKQDSKYLNISLIGLAKIAKIVKNESVNEGFGGELKGKDREKFEKARKENAEQLGYKLTGKGDIREAIKFSKKEMAQLHQNGKLEKDGYTYEYQGK
jgi:hypothetical protein